MLPVSKGKDNLHSLSEAIGKNGTGCPCRVTSGSKMHVNRIQEGLWNDREWSRNELILTLALYRKLGGHIPNTRHPGIITLAAELAEVAMLDGGEAAPGRSRAAVVFKLSNFRAIDPEAEAKGKRGFVNVGARDRAVWEEFANDPDSLEKAAEGIRRQLGGHREENRAPQGKSAYPQAVGRRTDR